MDTYYQRYFTKSEPEPLRRRPWTEPESLKLASMLKDGMRPAAIAKALGRTDQSIYTKIVRMGIKLPPRPDAWSSDELKILVDLVQRWATCKEMYRALPNRTHGGIRWQALNFGGVKGRRA